MVLANKNKMDLLCILLPTIVFFGASAQAASETCTVQHTTVLPQTTTASAGSTSTQGTTSPTAETTKQTTETTVTTIPSTVSIPATTAPTGGSGRRKRQTSTDECVANAHCLMVGGQLKCSCIQGHTADGDGFCQQDNAAGSQYKASTRIAFGAAILLMMMK
ncbi:hypothetical protein MAR_012896 [Mya arenaria]|uniref:EGF-like domain-containing protein n=1 Tax=Mya arenaria TaxID=6604 RepID=A0ABY7G1M9_MYAAR|nr:hypothetical protein MAR_012896 [Mya arenaria]